LIKLILLVNRSTDQLINFLVILRDNHKTQVMTKIVSHSKILITIGLLMFTQFVQAQNSKAEKDKAQAETIQKLIDSHRFMFVAQSALPMSEGVRLLTSEYDVKVKNDTLESYLPYYGKAYTGIIGSSDNGLQFKTTQFAYDIKPDKKDGWIISLKPKSMNSLQNMVLSVSSLGYANLQANFRDRQGISFNGIIQEIK